MKIHSIRWQLPASYAAIALLAALSLGGMLLFTLRRYYTELEQQYLIRNSSSISLLVGNSLHEGASSEELQASINSLSFLSQIHIEVFDAEGSLLASTPQQDVVWVSIGKIEEKTDHLGQTISITSEDEGDTLVYAIKAGEALEMAPLDEHLSLDAVKASENFSGIVTIISKEDEQVTAAEGSLEDDTGSMFAISRSMYAMDISGETPENNLSDQSITQVIRDENGTLGSIHLSQGPAYGRSILRTVARGWLLAGSLAVLLAGGVGIIVSRRITRPLGILGETTTRMSQGELDMRANVQRKDEFGSLALSFNHMADRIQDTIQTLRRFVADAAHELQTPVTALHTDLELTLQDLERGKQQRAIQVYLPRALSQVERMKNLSASLLDLSRLEAGEKSNAWQNIDLQQLLASLSESWAARAEQTGIDFTLHNCSEPVYINGSQSQLCQALENLLDNAVKFTPAGGSIQVGLSLAGEFARVQVQDSGIGIPAQDLPQLFSRFHRGSNASDYTGSGLGLAIVRAIAEQHGGSVSCRPADPGPGTVFELLLPLE